MSEITRLAELVEKSNNITCFSGAGSSTELGAIGGVSVERPEANVARGIQPLMLHACSICDNGHHGGPAMPELADRATLLVRNGIAAIGHAR